MLCVICSCQERLNKRLTKTTPFPVKIIFKKNKTFWVLQEKVVDSSMTHSAITHNKPTRLKGAITGVCANNVQPAEWLPEPSTAAEWEHNSTGGGGPPWTRRSAEMLQRNRHTPAAHKVPKSSAERSIPVLDDSATPWRIERRMRRAACRHALILPHLSALATFKIISL